MKVEAELRETKRSGKEEEEEESAGCAVRVAEQRGAVQRRLVGEGTLGVLGWRRGAAERQEVQRRERQEEEAEARGCAACVAAQLSAVQRRRVGEGGLGRVGWRRVAAGLREAKRRGKEEEEVESAGCAERVAEQKSAVQRRRVGDGAWGRFGWMRGAAERREARRQGKQEEEEEAEGRLARVTEQVGGTQSSRP